MDANAKLQPGKDTIRDPFTGVEYEIERIWRSEDVKVADPHGTYYKSRDLGTCAFYATEGNSREKTAHQRRQHTRLIVRHPKQTKGAA